MSSQSPGPPEGAAGIIHFASLAAHHRWLVFYGLIQVAAAFLATLLVRLDPARISLELPGREEGLSHPVLVVWLVLVLATAALTYAAAGAARSAWWLRLAVAVAVGGMLAQLAYAAGVLALAAPPIVVVLGLILWGRRAESARHPHPQLFGGLGLCIAVVWLLIAGFGLRPPELGALGALYLALSVLTAGAAFVPVPILLLSGLDLAEAAEAWASRLGQWGGRLGEQAPAALLLALAVLKLGFYAAVGTLHADSGWWAAALFALAFALLARRLTPALLEFEPRLGHWLLMAACLLAVPLVAVVWVLAGGEAANAGQWLLGALGPAWLALAGVLALRPKLRPFAVFTLLAGLWVTLSIGLQPLAERLWGVQATGLGLRHVDALSAVGFALFGGRLLVSRRRSHWVPLALTATLFLDAGYVLEQMLQAHVAVAELYVVLQAAGFLLVRQVAERRSLGWRRPAPWLVVAAVFVLSRLHGGLADALGQFVQTDVIAAAIIWDLLMSEERLGARRPGGSLSRPGRLLLYLGYVTWSVAQLVYAGTGAGTEALALEPVLALGFVVFGMPRVLHGFLAHLRSGGAKRAPAAEGA